MYFVSTSHTSLRRTLLLIGIISFCITASLQALMWSQNDMIDIEVWANEAQYIVSGNPLAFEGGAYGYPAGPIIDGTIVTQFVTGLDYKKSLLIFVTLFCSLITTLSAVVAYLFTRSLWWPVALVATLSIAPMYQHATPTTACISVLTVLICIYTAYLLKEPADKKLLILWGILAGIMLCTRLDIGSIFIFVCGIFLLKKYGLKRFFIPLLAAAASFAVLDPFLWLIPIQHVYDMIVRIVYHYFEYPAPPVPRDLVVYFSLMAFTGMFVAAISLLRPKDRPLPAGFTFALLSVTALLYAVFLTSHSQAMRYFQPMIFLWEALLPLFVFHFISKMEFSFILSETVTHRIKVAIGCLFIAALCLRSGLIFYSWWVL